MKTIHQSDSRGKADFGWLKSRHTFSFGRYYNPERVSFGALRVLNDDIVEPGAGFGTHPHDNMEIVSIPLSGDLAHKDSTGNTEVIRTGDVQIMSAGSGLTHSEFNHSKTDQVNFLQIWVLPKKMNISPRYEQKTFDPSGRQNQWQTVVSPDGEGLWINQDAYFHLADLEKDRALSYEVRKGGNGLYLFVIEGEVDIDGTALSGRDAIALTQDRIEVKAKANGSQVLLIDVPMQP